MGKSQCLCPLIDGMAQVFLQCFAGTGHNRGDLQRKDGGILGVRFKHDGIALFWPGRGWISKQFIQHRDEYFGVW